MLAVLIKTSQNIANYGVRRANTHRRASGSSCAKYSHLTHAKELNLPFNHFIHYYTLDFKTF